MDSFEWNKIFAAILVAGIVASFSGFIARHAINPHEVEATGVEEGGGAVVEAAPEMPEPVLAMIAGADPAKGEKLFKACAACHTATKGGPHGVGPNLWNVLNRGRAATDYSYSDAMAAHKGEQWAYIDLNKFLFKPKNFVPGTKMNFIGLKKPADRAAVIAYLRTLSDSPKGLPTDSQIAAEEAELAPAEPEEDIETEQTGAGEVEDSLPAEDATAEGEGEKVPPAP